MRTSEKILPTPLFTPGPQSSFYYGTRTCSFFSDAIVYFFFNVKKAKVILDFVPNTNKKQNLSFNYYISSKYHCTQSFNTSKQPL